MNLDPAQQREQKPRKSTHPYRQGNVGSKSNQRHPTRGGNNAPWETKETTNMRVRQPQSPRSEVMPHLPNHGRGAPCPDRGNASQPAEEPSRLNQTRRRNPMSASGGTTHGSHQWTPTAENPRPTANRHQRRIHAKPDADNTAQTSAGSSPPKHFRTKAHNNIER